MQDYPLKLHVILSVFGKFVVNFTDGTHISMLHTVHNREMWDICKGERKGKGEEGKEGRREERKDRRKEKRKNLGLLLDTNWWNFLKYR